jgi:hypothetical protein
MNVAVATDSLAKGRFRADIAVTNVTNADYETLVYRDDADAVNSDGSRKYPHDLEGEGRAVQVGVEVAF